MGTRQEELDDIKRTKAILENQGLIMGEIKDLRREQMLLRKGKEGFDWGQEVEDSDEVDLSDVPPKESE